MRPRQFVTLVVLCGTVALAAWGAARLGGFGSFGVDNTATPIGDGDATHGATSLSAEADVRPRRTTGKPQWRLAAAAVRRRHPQSLTPSPRIAPAAMSVGGGGG